MDISVIGIALITSGTVSTIMVSYLNSRKSDIKLKQEKLEMLFIDLAKWIKIHRGIIVNIFDFLEEKTIELNPRDKEITHDIMDRSRMIVGIYFPELQVNLDKLTDCRDGVNSVYNDLNKLDDYNKVKDKAFKKIQIVKMAYEAKNLSEGEKLLREAIFTQSSKIHHVWWKFKR